MKLIINNLKMNLTLPEIINYESELSNIETNNKIVICPSFPYLTHFKSNNYYLGSQNVSHIKEGSLTGEVSAKQLKSLDVKYTIVGHSERKEKLLEDNNQITEKIKLLFENDICPVLCIGELSKANLNIENEIKENLEDIFRSINNINNIVIAYEPVWAIGTGIIPDNSHIGNNISIIKKWFKDKYNTDIKVIYGGSVNTSNITSLNNISNLDGYLLGGTSLNINLLKEIIKYTEVQ